MKRTLARTRTNLGAGLLLCHALLGTPPAKAAPAEPALAFANAFARFPAQATTVRSISRQLQPIQASANEHLQNGRAGLDKLKAGAQPPSYVGIYSARDELRTALDTFERMDKLSDQILQTLGAMQLAIYQEKPRASAAAPAEKAKLAEAEQLFASTLLIGQEATGPLHDEIASETKVANALLLELDSLAKQRQRANSQNSVCDIHRINWRSFPNYPPPVRIWIPNLTNPSFDQPPPDGYELESADHADLNGNGRIEAIVRLKQVFFGQAVVFVFEMDAKCGVQRLAQINGTALDRVRVRGKSLFIDQPTSASDQHANVDEPACKEQRIRRFVWQFAAGKLRSSFSDRCDQP